MSQKCLCCPVKNENLRLVIENSRIQTAPLHQRYEKKLEESRHWHEKWKASVNQKADLSQEVKNVKKENRLLQKEVKNMGRGLEKRDQTIDQLKDVIASQKEQIESFASALENLQQTGESLEMIINMYMALFGPLPQIQVIMQDQNEPSSPAESEPVVSAEEPQSCESPLSEEELENCRVQLQEKELECQKLRKQIGRNSRNSSVPSSAQGLGRKSVSNNRESSGLKRGGQPGHPGVHLDYFDNPDFIVDLLTDEKFLNPDLYRPTGKKCIKQIVDLTMKVVVTQYECEVYEDRKRKYHVNGAAFPDGLTNKVTYGSSVKAAAMFLHTIGNMSYGKVQEYLKESTGGRLNISRSELQSLEKEFSKRTVQEREEILSRMFQDPWMGIDASPIRVDGHYEYVLTLTTISGVIYVTAKKKGEDLVWKTPLLRLKKSQKERAPELLSQKQTYQGVMVHDCEAEFFNYGLFHQLCMEHELRYLRGVAENEKDVFWAGRMREFLKQLIHRVQQLKEEGKERMDSEEKEKVYREYEEHLKLGENEYQQLGLKSERNLEYRDGPKVHSRLQANQEMLLYFLDDFSIPYTNNDSERSLRTVKMHGKQCGGYFSSKAVEYYLDALGVLESVHRSGGSRYQKLLKVLGPKDLSRELNHVSA